MKPRELAAHVKLKASATVSLSAADTANRFRRRTPGNRKKTRRAVFHEVDGLKAKVGLRFTKKYPTAGTTTKQQFAEQWRDIKPVVKQLIVSQLNEALKGN